MEEISNYQKRMKFKILLLMDMTLLLSYCSMSWDGWVRNKLLAQTYTASSPFRAISPAPLLATFQVDCVLLSSNLALN